VTTQIALLRGINVGGHKQVAMADLRSLLSKLGFADVQSLLQSGNLMFRSGSQAGSRLERLLENEIEKHLGLQCSIFVRSAAEWREVVARNPFREEARRDPGHLLAMILKSPPEAARLKALQAAIQGSEVVRAAGSCLYIVYPDGVGRSRLTNALIEKTLGTRGTARNWNTVLKLNAIANACT
jgi:uncharacterized protein (DUF1697 family)